MRTKTVILTLVFALLALCSYAQDSLITKLAVSDDDTLTQTEEVVVSENISLSSQQYYELEKMKLENKKMQIKELVASNQNNVKPVLMAVTPFLTAIIIVLIVLYFDDRQKKAKYELMSKAIESGATIPTDFFASKKKIKNYLASGLTTLATGLGIIIFGIIVEEVIIGIGAIVAFVGLAYLGVWKFEQSQKNSNSRESESHE
ncbi:MAG: DUF6249 domain-containing protein [Bacteroidales bacterium]